jgi:hypothetical protein
MMKEFSRVLIVAVALAGAAACAKKQKAETAPEAAAETPAPAPEAPKAAAPKQTEAAADNSLPGAADVRDALARKDYSGAVERLTALKTLAVAGDAWIKYRELSGEVGLALSEAAKTDQNAVEALRKYQLATYGR